MEARYLSFPTIENGASYRCCPGLFQLGRLTDGCCPNDALKLKRNQAVDSNHSSRRLRQPVGGWDTHPSCAWFLNCLVGWGWTSQTFTLRIKAWFAIATTIPKKKMTRQGIEPRMAWRFWPTFQTFLSTLHPRHKNNRFVFRRTVHCGYLIPWESSNSVATPVMQSLKSPVAPGEPGWPSRALEQTKNRLIWELPFLSLTRHDSVGLFRSMFDHWTKGMRGFRLILR